MPNHGKVNRRCYELKGHDTVPKVKGSCSMKYSGLSIFNGIQDKNPTKMRYMECGLRQETIQVSSGENLLMLMQRTKGA